MHFQGIKVWDMRDQTCLQNINPRNINMGPHIVNTVCFHIKTGSLILGTNQVCEASIGNGSGVLFLPKFSVGESPTHPLSFCSEKKNFLNEPK